MSIAHNFSSSMENGFTGSSETHVPVGTASNVPCIASPTPGAGKVCRCAAWRGG